MKAVFAALALVVSTSAGQAMTYNWPTEAEAPPPEEMEFTNSALYRDGHVQADKTGWRLYRVSGEAGDPLSAYVYALEAIHPSRQLLHDIGADVYEATMTTQFFEYSPDGTTSPLWGMWGAGSWFYELYINHDENGVWRMGVDYFVGQDPGGSYRSFNATGTDVSLKHSPAPVPVPASAIVLMTGLAALAAVRRRVAS